MKINVFLQILYFHMVSSAYSITKYRRFVSPSNFTTKNSLRRAGATKNGLNAPHDVFVSVFHVCLTILKNFAKKNIKICKKFTKLDFGQIFLKISKISKNLENIFENFPLKIVLKIENFENFENFDFSIFNTIFNGNFSKIFFAIFEIFKNFEIFRFRIFVGNQTFFNFFDDFFF